MSDLIIAGRGVARRRSVRDQLCRRSKADDARINDTTTAIVLILLAAASLFCDGCDGPDS